MRNNQLQKSNLYNLLCETGMQQAEGRVRSQSLMEEMSLIGFIPYTDDYVALWDFEKSVNLNSQLYVAPFLVKFSKDTPTYPYFKCVKKAEGKKYKVHNQLYMDTVLNQLPDYVLKAEFTPRWRKLTRPLSGDTFLDMKTKSWNPESLLVSDEDGIFCYVGKADDWELSSGLGDIVYISNNFLCLCSYMNKITGLPSYAVLTSDDTIRVLSENNTEDTTGTDNKYKSLLDF